MPNNLAEYYRGLEAAAAALAAAGDCGPAERAGAVHAAIAPLLAATPHAAELACRRGCDHCCRFPVGVTFAETMRLATRVRAHRRLADAVTAAAAASAAVPWTALAGVPCPLLRDAACAVHDVRPLPCRALGSRDAAACAAALTGDAEVPRDEVAFWRGLGAGAALGAGVPAGVRELRSALAAVLAAPADPVSAFAAARAAG